MNIKQRNGFTLVELLIVIAIISILAAMLLPVLKSARETAQSIHCMNNFKQMHLGLMQYSHDFRGLIPYVKSNDAAGTDLSHSFWKHVIGVYLGLTPDLPYADLPGGWTNYHKYLKDNGGLDFANILPNPSYARRINKNMGIFNCPSQKREAQYSTTEYQSETGPEYAMNYHLIKNAEDEGKHRSNRRVRKIWNRRIVFMDGGETYNHYGWYVHVSPVHLGLAHFSFIDGHVESTIEYGPTYLTPSASSHPSWKQ